MSLSSRKELAGASRERYGRASKKEKGKILDEFCKTSGYQRSYAATVLSKKGRGKQHRAYQKSSREKEGTAM